MKSNFSNRSDALGKDSGFTLVELLSVLFIVGLLAVLLFATIRSMRLKSADVACLAHLKTLATAYSAYRADYGGKGPPRYSVEITRGFFPFFEGGTYGGIMGLRYYYRSGPRYVRAAPPNSSTWIIEPTEYCPAAKLTGIADFTDELPARVHYTMILGEPALMPDGTTQYMQVNFSAVAEPSQIPILWDSWKGTFEWELPLRHGSGVNTAFLDGHVENIPQSKEDGRLYRGWWESAVSKKAPDPDQLGKGAPLGAKQR